MRLIRTLSVQRNPKEETNDTGQDEQPYIVRSERLHLQQRREQPTYCS